MFSTKERRGIDKSFRAMLSYAEKWHTLREHLSIGILTLVPEGANTWFEKLPINYLRIYVALVRAVNPNAVAIGEMISDRVLSL